jgi:4-amino-4-deoxychorismate lyase
MVKFFENSFNYEYVPDFCSDSADIYSYSFPAVTLAYFLRYPNPYSTHVVATDVIDSYFDPVLQRLHTTRLHLKRGKLPTAVVKLLPKSLLGSTKSNSSESFVLEKSVVDIKEGWMQTENRNLEWTGVLTVVEKQYFERPRKPSGWDDRSTNVTTSVMLLSRLGQGRLLRGRGKKQITEEPKQGLFASLSSGGLQRSVEAIGLRRTSDANRKSREGMKVVLERLRTGGLVLVLEGMRQDQAITFGQEGPWKRAPGGDSQSDENSPQINEVDPFEDE